MGNVASVTGMSRRLYEAAYATIGQVRGGLASAVSQAVDTLIFITVAFYGQFDIVPLLIGQAIAKVVLSFVLVPLIIWVLVRFAREG